MDSKREWNIHMSDVLIVENKLKIFSDDISIVRTLLRCVPNTIYVNTPELADISITNKYYDLDYNIISLKDFWNDGHIFWSIPNKCSRFDQETITTFIKGRIVKYDNIMVSPCHEFINNQDFLLFKEIHNNLTFDLFELNGSNEILISYGTLDELIEKNSSIFTNKLANVIYSKDRKYFVRLHNIESSSSYKKINGFLCTDDSGILQIATDIEMDSRLKPFLYLIFTRFTGAFTVEYYEDVNKIQIVKFKTGLSKDHIKEDILNIDVVQNTFKRMSTRYNFERNVNG